MWVLDGLAGACAPAIMELVTVLDLTELGPYLAPGAVVHVVHDPQGAALVGQVVHEPTVGELVEMDDQQASANGADLIVGAVETALFGSGVTINSGANDLHNSYLHSNIRCCWDMAGACAPALRYYFIRFLTSLNASSGVSTKKS